MYQYALRKMSYLLSLDRIENKLLNVIAVVNNQWRRQPMGQARA